MQLRPYQSEASESVWTYLNDVHTGKSPLIVLPTGTGKSLVIADLCKQALQKKPTARIVMLTHVKELIEQNYEKLKMIWPLAPAGIYSASIGRKDHKAQILYAGIQSLARAKTIIGFVDIVIIDEAHLVPKGGDGQYRTVLEQFRRINPHVRVVGLTASPYRLSGGILHKGDGAIFDGISYEAKLLDMIEQGFLSPLSCKKTVTEFDLSNVHKRGGEFIESELQAAVNKRDVNEQAIAEMIKFGRERHHWILFCAGVKHAETMSDMLNEAGIRASHLNGNHTAMQRDAIISDFKAGRTRAICNTAILTTGFDAPFIDMVCMLRPTMSPGLYVQMVGRGFRKAEGKKDCLVLDFAENISRHGPIDRVTPPPLPGEKGDRAAPVKVCPECHEVVYASTKICPACEHEFISDIGPKHSGLASRQAILSSQEDEPTGKWAQLIEPPSATWYRKEGGKPCIKITHKTIMGQTIYDWYHPNSMNREARIKIARRCGLLGIGSVNDIDNINDSLKKYWKALVLPVTPFAQIAGYRTEFDDEIIF